ncbi:MAG: asparagine synthase (glutamine-hydrolyzing), partial [Planctomycetota bacterium]
MCGIAGIYAYHPAASEPSDAELRRISEYMVARGPDGSGEWFSSPDRVGFAHRRLAIIDLSERASQPMESADGKLVVVFNGAIYNHAELRRGLEAEGRVFRSNSDTEVLLHLYQEKGEAMVQELRGMFAFTLWDAERRGLLLARDPYGIKPLYYADNGKTFRFASQVKALLAGGGLSRENDPAGLVGFYLFGSVPEPYTMYEQVRAVPAGTTLWIDRSGPRKAQRYFSIAEVFCRAESTDCRDSPSELAHHCREALIDSIQHHLVSDVPVGVFLSSGADSGALLGLMRDLGREDIKTVTLAFEEFQGTPNDEAPIAADVAKYYGTRHTTRVVGSEEFRE